MSGRIGRANKLWVLGRLIANMSENGQMLIFSNTKRMVDVIVERLGKFQMKEQSYSATFLMMGLQSNSLMLCLAMEGCT